MHLSIISTLLLAFLLPATAQDEGRPKKSGTGVEVRLLAEIAPPNLGKVYLAAGETTSATVDLPTNELSPPMTMSSRELLLKTVEKGLTLCPILLPEEGKSFAVILVTAKPSGYKPIIVRTDDPTFKVGDVMFINRSEKIVLGKLGDTPLIVNPGEVKKSRPSNPKEDAFYDIAFAVREPAGDRLISSTRWPIDGSLRSYVFFFTNAEGRTTFRAVDEFIVPSTAGTP
jgi:hypothetical protein